MGVSTDGQICFGVLFEEGYEFPWDCEEYDYDIDVWWDEMNGFNPPFPFNSSLSEEEQQKYFEYRRNFKKQHPLPVDTVNYCSCDYPMYILAIPKTWFIANRGYPVKFNPKELEVSQNEINNLLDFCEKYGLKFIDGPVWFLSSNWC